MMEKEAKEFFIEEKNTTSTYKSKADTSENHETSP